MLANSPPRGILPGAMRRWARKPSLGRAILSAAAALACIAAPLAFTPLHANARQDATRQAQAASASKAQAASAIGPEFKYDVASIKPDATARRSGVGGPPDGFMAQSVTVMALLQRAYPDFAESQFIAAPHWLSSERYDVIAKMDPSVADELQKFSPDQRKLARQQMLQALLADRFGLKSHRETKPLLSFVLAVATGGPKLSESKPGSAPTGDFAAAALAHVDLSMGLMEIKTSSVYTRAGRTVQSEELVFWQAPLVRLTRFLTQQLHQPVTDRTGLAGRYDFTLRWIPTEPIEGTSENGAWFSLPSADATSDQPAFSASTPSGGTNLPKALEQQLGLKLEPGKGPVEVLVIDHVERPSEN